MKSKIAIFSGSFNTFHLGHLFILKRGLEEYKEVIILISNQRKKMNKSFLIRETEIKKILEFNNLENIRIIINDGLTINKAKELHCKTLIRGYRDYSDLKFELKLLFLNKFLAPSIKTKLYKSNEIYKNIRSSKNN